jgi:hypothetical protein
MDGILTVEVAPDDLQVLRNRLKRDSDAMAR